MSAKKQKAAVESFTAFSSPEVRQRRQGEHTSHCDALNKQTTLQNAPTPHAQEDNDTTELELCTCVPLSSQCLKSLTITQDETLPYEHIVPAPTQLCHALYAQVQALPPGTAPFSMLLLHVSQLEQRTFDEEGDQHQPRRYHVTHDVLAQILRNARRAVRQRDELIIEGTMGAAMLFPSVDEQGIQNILERVYQHIALLQAETIVPPLARITDIVLGYGTLSAPATWSGKDAACRQRLETLLASTGRVARRLLLRPALAMSLWDTMPTVETPTAGTDKGGKGQETRQVNQPAKSIPNTSSSASTAPDALPYPFLHLPKSISPRLKRLLPYAVAQQLRCVPVGRDHHTLTVAMIEPDDKQALQYLRNITGMTIFPVSCEHEALMTLLTEQW
jgi:hypothetical protein